MMKNTIKMIALMVLLVAGLGVSAQQVQKLGHIETEKLIKIMPEMAVAEKTLQAKQDEMVKEMTSLNEQYQKLIADYTANSKTYSDIVRQSKEQEIQGLQQRIQNFQEIATNDFDKTKNDLLQPIMDKALNAIKEVSKENGFTYVFDMSSGVLLFTAESAEDILPMVKKKLGLQ